MSKGKKALSLTLQGIDNIDSKNAIECPTGQPKHIQRLFRQILSEINGVQLVQGDAYSILILAQNLDLIAIANKELAKQGYVITSKSGYVQPNPFIAIKNSSTNICIKLFKQLGLTPASRKVQGAHPIPETQNPL